MDLMEFMRARMDETERQAREDDCVHLAPVWTAFVLAEVEVTRTLARPHGFKRLNSDGDALCTGHDAPTLYPCRTLRTLVRPYADHPDFDPAWRQ